MRSFQVITFDCYGTLIDWEAGIVEAFWKASMADGVSLDPAAVLRTLFETEPAAARAYQSYREILTAAAQRVGQRLGWPMTHDRAAFLADSLPDWPPFPDTNDALRRLSRAGYALGILSNVDDDLLAGTRRRLEAEFSLLVTAAFLKLWKPKTIMRLEGDKHVNRSVPATGSMLRKATITTLSLPSPTASRSPGSIARRSSQPPALARLTCFGT